MKHTFSILAVLILSCLFCGDALAWNTGMDAYSYRKYFTIESDEVAGSSDLTNFMVCLVITDDTDLDDANTRDDYYDITFVRDADGSGAGTELDYERVSASEDASGFDGIFWIEVDTLSYNTDTRIYIYYGDSDQTVDQADGSGAWGSDYELVMHLEESSGTFYDSSPEGNDGTDNVSGSTGSCVIGDCPDFDGSDDQIDLTSQFAFDDNYTMTVWLEATWADMWCGDTDAGTEFMGITSSTQIRLNTGANRNFTVSTLTSGTWYMISVKKNTTDWYVRVNKTASSSNPITADADILIDTIGDGYNNNDYTWPNGIDEVIVAKSFRSDDWLDTMYNNQYAPTTFIPAAGWGSEEEYTPPEEICNNGIDDDLDGDIDCEDSDCSGDAACSVTTNTDQDFPGDDRPTGIGNKTVGCDFYVTSTGSQGEETNTDPTGASHYISGYFKITEEGLDDGEEFRIVELRNGGDAAIYGTVQQSGGQLQLKWTYYLGSETTTSAKDIETNVWYFSKLTYIDDGSSDEVEIETYACDFSIYSALGFSIDLSSQTGARSACTDLDYGVDEATFSGSGATTTIYFDEWHWSSSAHRGALGLVKQNLSTNAYYALDWTPTYSGGDIDIYEGFNARSYHPDIGSSDTGYEYDGWQVYSAGGTYGNVLPNSTAWSGARGPYSCLFEVDATYDTAYLEETFDPDPTEVYLSFLLYVVDNTNYVPVIQAFDASSNQVFAVSVDHSDSAVVFSGYGITVRSGSAYNQDEECLVELYYKHGSGDGKFTCWINGTMVGTAQTGLTTRGAINWLWVGPTDSTQYETTRLHIDEFAFASVSDSDGTERMGEVSPDNYLTDDSDNTYFSCGTESTEWNEDNYNLVTEFETYDEIGTIKALRAFFKGKEYANLDKRLFVGYTYEMGVEDRVSRYPEAPTYLADQWEWLYKEWSKEPCFRLKYDASDSAFEGDVDETYADANEIKGSDSGMRAYIFDIDKTEGVLRIAKNWPWDDDAWEFKGAGYGWFEGETITLTDSANTTEVVSDHDTESIYLNALDWDDASNFLFLIKTAKGGAHRWEDDMSDGGGMISEVYGQAISTEDSQEILTHYIGSTAWTDGIAIKGRTSGAAYVEVRYGTTEADVISNSNNTWTTSTGTLTGDHNDYVFHINILDGDTVKDTSGSDHTVSYSTDSLYNQVIYFDIRIKGASASSWYSVYQLEGTGTASDHNNPVWLDMTNSLLATVAFPSSSATDTLKFVQMSDDHGTDHPELWETMETKLADTADGASFGSFFWHLGDEVPDPGDRLQAARDMWADYSGFQNKRFTWTHVRSRWPYHKSYSDHDYFVNDCTKAGSMQYGKTSLTYLRTFYGLQVNKEWTVFPQGEVSGSVTGSVTSSSFDDSGGSFTNDEHIGREVVMTSGSAQGEVYWISDNDADTLTFLSGDPSSDGVSAADTYKIVYYLMAPDYNGNYQIDVRGTATGGSTTTLEHSGRDFDDTTGPHWVAPGMPVHNRTDQVVGIVSSVSDDTITFDSALQDFDGTTGADFDSNDEYSINRAGIWRNLQWGTVAEFFVTETRYKSDPSATPGCDFYDGTSYGSGEKDSGTTADPPGSDDRFKLYQSGQNFSSTCHAGDAVIVTSGGTDYYAHVVSVDDNETLTLDRDIADSPFGESFEIRESGASVRGTQALDHAAGHIQRTWLEKAMGDSTRLAKFIVSDTNVRHNAARWHDSISDRDGVCYGNSDELAKTTDPGYPVSDNYIHPLPTKLDVDNVSGTFTVGEYIYAGTTGARGRINAYGDDNSDSYYTITFETEFGGIAEGDDTGWAHVVHGEFIDNEWVYECAMSDLTSYVDSISGSNEVLNDADQTFTVDALIGMTLRILSGTDAYSEYTIDDNDANSITCTGDDLSNVSAEDEYMVYDAKAQTRTPPGDAEFTADDPATFVDYNRFWKASATREHTMQYLQPFPNIFYLVGDRHYNAICDATHSDDFYIQVDSAPAGWNMTWAETNWCIDEDNDGYCEKDEVAIIHQENIDYTDMGGFALISVDYINNEVQIDLLNADGDNWSATHVTNPHGMQTLSLTVFPSLVWIDEGFEETGGEEDWLGYLIWYADDYWLDDAVGM